MAAPATVVTNIRSRVSVVLKAFEDLVALQTEFNALGGTTFTNLFQFSDEGNTGYDLTEAEFNAGLTAVGQMITAFQNGSLTANATRQQALYKLKV